MRMFLDEMALRNLLYVIFSIFVIMIILYPAYASGVIERTDNESIKNYSQAYDNLGIVDKDTTEQVLRFEAKKTESLFKNDIYSNPSSILLDKQSEMISFGLDSYWSDPYVSCNTNFKCTADFSTGWKDKTSFRISTTNTSKGTWSVIHGQQINVKPQEDFKMVTHMKLDQWATQSHIALEGFNETSKQWHQINQCPSGTNGPLRWQEFSCTIAIPENITKIRPVINAGWSSQPGKEAATWFDSIYMFKFGASSDNETETIFKSNMYSNPSFVLIDNESRMASIGLSSFWKDENKSCNTNFKCTSDFSTGWKDKTSFQISSINNSKDTWSRIYGQPIDVMPREKYQLVTHMKLNQLATQSHVAFEGFNKRSQLWYQINQCPSGTNGPLRWQEFSCTITMPENITKIRPILNAGWSSQPGKEAATWFDSIYLIKINEQSFVLDPDLKTELVYQGLKLPTSMTFLGPNDILVLEKNNGTVQRIVNGVKLEEPILDVDVANRSERGMLGIAIVKNMTTSLTGIDNESTYVFLYFTEAKNDGGEPLGNRLYRYELVDNKLVNPKLLLDLPLGLYHNGGKILIGPDNYLYLIVGELDNSTFLSQERNKALNNQSKEANEPDGRGGILRIDQNGHPIGAHGILGDKEPLNKYYAYGIRNSFGMDFDPVTGKLWDTENGPFFGDEINLVEPGFNSGWRMAQGAWMARGEGEKEGDMLQDEPHNLVDFDGKGNYSSPEFTWKKTVAPTAIKFLSTDKLGKENENDILVADVTYGKIYHFELNQARTGLVLQGQLMDKIANNAKELNDVVFAQGFNGGTNYSELGITDMEIGPDGYLYILEHGLGKIYRIVPA